MSARQFRRSPHLRRPDAQHSSEMPHIVPRPTEQVVATRKLSRNRFGRVPEADFPARNDFRLARHSERFVEALRSVVFLSFSALLLGAPALATPSRELFMVLPGGCLSALLADASRADHFGEGVQRTIRLLPHFRHVLFVSQALPLSHRLAFFSLCPLVFPNPIVVPCVWLPSPVLRRPQYIWGRSDWCVGAWSRTAQRI